jgi:flagellar biogenesis protein FliO
MGSTTAYAIETLVTLLGILLLAVVVLFGARRLGVGRAVGPLELLGRLPLDGRKSVYLVRIGQKSYALLASETALTKLDEIALGTLPPEVPTSPAFAQLLLKALGKKTDNTDAQ